MPSAVRLAALFSALLHAGVAVAADPVPAPPTDSAPVAPPAPPTPPESRPPLSAPREPQGPYPAPVPLWIFGESNERLAVAIFPEWATPGSMPPLARCVTPCAFTVWQGRYRVAVAETPETFAGNRVVEIYGPSRLVVTPRDKGKRTLGMLLGIGGPVLIVAGLLVAVHGSEVADRQGCTVGDSCSSRWTPEMTTGLLLVVGGMAVTPIGWVMYGKSFRPGVETDRGMASSAVAPRFGVIAMPGGAGLGGRIAF